MAYSDLASNQGVSFNSLISGVSQGYFSAKTTIPSTNKMATKSACNTYVTVNPSYPPFAAKSDNQLVVKQDLQNNEATLYITNNFFTGTITNVTVNGVSITGASFPLDVGNGTTGYTTQVGTYNILVYYADANMPSNYMRITDSAYNTACIDGFSSLGPGPYYVTFTSQVINTSVGVFIESGDGQCTAPPPTLITDLPFSTVAVSRTTGQYMLAGNANLSGGYSEGALFRSTNYGANWQLVGQLGYWYKVATSDNGQFMLAVEYYGRAYRSSDYGSTWTAINNFPYPDNNPYGLPVLQTLNFRGTALSADGQFQVISTSQTFYGTYIAPGTQIDSYYTTIFVSSDYGNNWIVGRNDTAGTYNAVAISASGQTVLAATGTQVVAQGSILRSNNYGVNWGDTVDSTAAGQLVDVSILADGSKAVAARFSNDYEPFLMRSLDGGVTWVNITGGQPAAQQRWMRTAINANSSSGTTNAFALPNTVASTKYIHIASALSTVSSSTAAGLRYFKGIANSNNGQYVLAGANNGLFVSNDFGSTYTAILSVG
jgi:hypothetical protein